VTLAQTGEIEYATYLKTLYIVAHETASTIVRRKTVPTP